MSVSSSPGTAKSRPFATNGGLIKQLRRGVTGLRAVRAVFRDRSPESGNLRSLVFQGVDPDLLSVMLGRQLAALWVPPLWRLYNELRSANGPAFRADVFAAWLRVRVDWVPLWTQLRERLAAAVAASGTQQSGSSPRGSGRPPVSSAEGDRASRRRRSATSSPSADASIPGSGDDSGTVDLGVHGTDKLVSVDGMVHRIADPGAASVDPALAAALAAMAGVMLRRRAGDGVGADRPSQGAGSVAPPQQTTGAAPRLLPVPPSPPTTVVTVPVPPVPLPDFRAIAGVVPGYPPPFLFQLWLAMRSSVDDVTHLRQTWVSMGGSGDLWDQWMWPAAPVQDWGEQTHQVSR